MGGVYLVYAKGTNFFKIGYTEGKAYKRVPALQTGCPLELLLTATMCDKAKEDEKRLLSKWRNIGIPAKGGKEWFWCPDELILDLFKDFGVEPSQTKK